MGEPLYKSQRNKRTGEVRDLESTDGGKTWHETETSKGDRQLNAAIESNGPEDKGDAIRGVADVPVQPEPAWHEGLLSINGAAPTPTAAGLPPGFKPVPSAPPTQQDRDAVEHEQELDARGSTMPYNTPDEAALRSFGQMTTLGLGDELAAGAHAFGNWTRSMMGGTDPLTGDPAETQGRGMDAPLKGYDDYHREQTAALEQGARDFPVESGFGTGMGLVTAAPAMPRFAAAEGAPMLAQAARGAGNIALDTGVGSATAAASAAPGKRLEAAAAAAPWAGGVSAGLRVPFAATKAGAELARRMSTAAMPAETAEAAQRLTAATPAGAQWRAAALAGQRDLDPTVRKVTQNLSDIEESRDALTHWARNGAKPEAMTRAAQADMDALSVPRPTTTPGDMEFELPGGQPVKVSAEAPTVPGMATNRPPRGGRARAASIESEAGQLDSEATPSTPAMSPPPMAGAEGSVLAGARAQDAIQQGTAQLDAMSQQLDTMLAGADDLTPPARQAIRSLRQKADSVRGKLDYALNGSGENPAAALAQAHRELDLYKQELGSFASRFEGSRDNAMTYQELNSMYHSLRDHLEDAGAWGQGIAGKQQPVNAAWTNDFTVRPRYERTVLTSDEAKRGVDPFTMIGEGDPAKVEPLYMNAGRARNAVNERALREGLGANRNLLSTLAEHYDAPPELRQKVATVTQASDEIGRAFDETIRNATAAREMRDVAGSGAPFAKWIAGGAQGMAQAESLAARYPAVASLLGVPLRAAAGAPRFGAGLAGAATGSQTRQQPTRGHEAEDRVGELLSQSPQSLGPYAQQLAQAKANGTLGAELYRLESDATWRTQVKPQLQR